FALLKEDVPIEFTGKSQKRPLALLKFLLALGGRDISLNLVLSSLWPESDGDAAAAAFNMALKRLRKLLGQADVIRLTAGKITINPRLCWVDAWAFQRRLEFAKTDVNHIEHALALYRGQFLGTEEPDWALSIRERLRTKFLRGTRTLGRELESRSQWNKAIDLYEHSIEVDDSSEELYRLLLLNHEKLGQHAEAMSVYRRCEVTLAKQLGVAPGTQTQAIYRRLLKAGSIAPIP
ncbi:MAG: bacterial transcriptional activator domain-containing protein, partial [Halioglobus sp.]|nr:bacterial transcriptional activator domain-containing protein [Halioglobus sp.]